MLTVDAIGILLVVIQGLLALVGLIVLVSGLDDLFVDVCWYGLRLRNYWRPRAADALPTQDELSRLPQQPIAVMVPAWDESAVIRPMLTRLIRTIDYSNFHVFVGVYPNDAATQREAALVAEQFPNVHQVVCDHDGPTNKADCLNSIYQGIRRFERAHEAEFQVFVMNDSEDMVHPLYLRLMNAVVPGADLVQIPVIPVPPPWHHFSAGHYVDEFAENHRKDVRVREALTGIVPSAGVGTAFSRRALLLSAAAHHTQLFSTRSLTEDYDISFRLHEGGQRQRFVWYPVHSADTKQVDYIAIREHFPETLRAAYRQKARWILGIALQGWEHRGWPGSLAEKYLLFRDRKGLVTTQVAPVAYLVVAAVVAIWGWNAIDPESYRYPPLVQRGTLLWNLVTINAIFLAIRLMQRALCVHHVHGWRQALLSGPRQVWGNLVNFAAGARALRLFASYWRTGKSIAWDKTAHVYPSHDDEKGVAFRPAASGIPGGLGTRSLIGAALILLAVPVAAQERTPDEYYLQRAATAVQGSALPDRVRSFRTYPRLDRAYRLAAQGRLTDARAELMAARAMDDTNLRIRAAYLVVLHQLADYPAVVSEAGAVIERWPVFVPALLYRGLAYTALKQPDAALRDFRAAAAHPGTERRDRIFALLTAEAAAHAAGRVAEEMWALEQMSRQAPSFAVEYRRGAALARAGRLAAARDAYAAAARLARSDADRQQALRAGVLTAAGGRPAVHDRADRAATLAPPAAASWRADLAGGRADETAGRYEQAVIRYRRAADTGGSAEAIRALASTLRRLGRPSEALPYMTRLALRTPTASIYLELAELQLAAHENESAAQSLEKARRVSRSTDQKGDIERRLGYVLFDLKRYPESQAAFASSLAHVPGHPATTQALAETLLRRYEASREADLLLHAAALDIPWNLRLTIASALADAGHHQAALDIDYRARQASDLAVRTRGTLQAARVRVAMGAPAAAADLYAELVAPGQTPDAALLAEAADALVVAGRTASALAVNRRLVTLTSLSTADRARALAREGYLQSDAGHPAEAAAAFEASLAIQPGEVATRQALARTLATTGQWTGVVNQLSRVLETQETAPSLVFLAQAYQALGRSTLAADAWRRALDRSSELEPNERFEASLALARLHVANADHTAAVAVLRAIDLTTLTAAQRLTTYEALGTAYAAAGDADQAIGYLSQGLQLAPDAALAYRIGLLHQASHRLDEAERFFLLASATDPTASQYQAALGYALKARGDRAGAARAFAAALALDPLIGPLYVELAYLHDSGSRGRNRQRWLDGQLGAMASRIAAGQVALRPAFDTLARMRRETMLTDRRLAATVTAGSAEYAGQTTLADGALALMPMGVQTRAELLYGLGEGVATARLRLVGRATTARTDVASQPPVTQAAFGLLVRPVRSVNLVGGIERLLTINADWPDAWLLRGAYSWNRAQRPIAGPQWYGTVYAEGARYFSQFGSQSYYSEARQGFTVRPSPRLALSPHASVDAQMTRESALSQLRLGASPGVAMQVRPDPSRRATLDLALRYRFTLWSPPHGSATSSARPSTGWLWTASAGF